MNKGMPVEFFYILLLSTIGAELMLYLCAAIETSSWDKTFWCSLKIHTKFRPRSYIFFHSSLKQQLIFISRKDTKERSCKEFS